LCCVRAKPVIIIERGVELGVSVSTSPVKLARFATNVYCVEMIKAVAF
jgi:hypothetical protein